MESDQNGSWMDLVQRSWNLLAAKKAISDVEVQYVSVNRRTEFTMDMLIEGIYFVVRCTVIKIPHPKREGGQVILLQNYPHPLSLRDRGPHHFPTPLNT